MCWRFWWGLGEPSFAVHPGRKQVVQAALTDRFCLRFETSSIGDPPAVCCDIFGQEAVKRGLPHVFSQLGQEKGAATVHDGAIFRSFVVICWQTDGDVGPLDAFPPAGP